MEYFTVYNHLGQPTSKILKRGETLQKGEYFCVVHVWFENEQGEFLIQQRAKKTDPIPHQWATLSGFVRHGETSIQSAIRESYEELGIKLNKKELIKRKTIFTEQDHYHTITHIYHVYTSKDISTLKLDLEEVKAVQYAQLDTIMEMIKNNLFWDYRYLLNDFEYFSRLEGSIL